MGAGRAGDLVRCRESNLTTQQRSRRGFSLLELLVATALLGIAIVGLLTLITGSLANSVVIRDFDRAAMLGRAKMNELLTVSPIDIGRPMGGEYNESWGWEAVVTPFEAIPPARVGGHLILRVQVVIWWRNATGRRQAEFDGYRTIRVSAEQEGLLTQVL